MLAQLSRPFRADVFHPRYSGRCPGLRCFSLSGFLSVEFTNKPYAIVSRLLLYSLPGIGISAVSIIHGRADEDGCSEIPCAGNGGCVAKYLQRGTARLRRWRSVRYGPDPQCISSVVTIAPVASPVSGFRPIAHSQKFERPSESGSVLA